MLKQDNLCLQKEQEELATSGIFHLFVKYAVPGVIGLLFLGIQAVIDGIVLSHFAGALALASVSLILPCYNFIIAAAIVTGIGCQTLVGLRLGQSDMRSANQALTTAFVFLLVFSAGMSALIFGLAPLIARCLGADTLLLEGSVSYIRTLVPFFPMLCLMFLGDYMLKIAGRPVRATIIMSVTVVLNIVLDLLFVGLWGWGISGAGLATGIAFTIGASCNVPSMFSRRQTVCVQRGRFRWRTLGQMLYNGSSEGISELSAGISVFLFNIVLMRTIGADGVAAFTVLAYILFIGVTVFLGISDGVIPIISYNHGSKRQKRVKAVTGLAVRTNLMIGVLLFVTLWLAGEQIVALFFKSDEAAVMNIAVKGASLYAFAFLFNGLNILASGYFTAIGDARKSVVISLCRGLVFISLGIYCLPRWFGGEGIWYVIPAAECCTLLVVLFLFFRENKRNLSGKVQLDKGVLMKDLDQDKARRVNKSA